MNKKLAMIAAPLVILATNNASAFEGNKWGLIPYVGAEAQWRHMDFNTGLGKNLMRHDFPQGNVFFGVQITDYLAIEAGYESTTKKSRSNTIQQGELSGGLPLGNDLFGNPIISANFHSTAQIRGPHINLVGYVPLSNTYQIDLIGMVGVGQYKATFVRTNTGLTIKNPITGNPLSITYSTPLTTTYQGRKNVLRLGAGVQQLIADNWGVRAMVQWQKTHKFKFVGNAEIGVKPGSMINANNSIIYSFGLFRSF